MGKKNVLSFLIVIFVSLVLSSTSKADYLDNAEDCIQVGFGVTKLDNDDSDISATSEDETEFVESSIDSLPTISIMGQMSLWGESLKAGIEGGLDGSWQNDTSKMTTSGGTSVIAVDNEVYLINVYYGLYSSYVINRKARLYLGAGGMASWGSVDVENDSDTIIDESETAFGVGAYARCGVEFELNSGYLIGAGVRSISTEIDFSDSIGEVELDGVQLMLTFTLPVSKGVL